MSIQTGAAALPYEQSIALCCANALGENGLSQAEFDAAAGAVMEELEALKALHGARSLPLLHICEERDDLDAAAAALAKLSEGARSIYFFGTGGSSLGGQTLAQLAGWNIPGQSAPGGRGRPRTRFYDNLDASTLQTCLEGDDLSDLRFVITSKSGGTTETLAQAIAAIAKVEAAGLADRLPLMFLGITEPDKEGKPNGLRTLLAAKGIPMLEHHTGIGGRYSCLTNVGLLPAMARGLDPVEIRAGAQCVIDQMLRATRVDECAPAVGAAVTTGLMASKGTRALVLMPYCDRLGRLAHWYVQLWAESLGKDGKGSFPIACLGPLDQHSQLQLFMDGPREHMVTVMRTGSSGEEVCIDADLARLAGADYMAGRRVADVVEAQSGAVPEALAQAGRPVRSFDIPRLDAFAMGALLMHFMIETILAGRAIGIDPFDQPAVELAKMLTRRRLADQQD